MTKSLRLALCFLLFLPFVLHAQLTGWTYKQVVDAVETAGVSHTNYQVQYTFDSQSLISANKLQANGGDLRFGDECGSTLYPYWIESGLNTGTTVVWILVPSVPANATTSFYMYYGNAAAPDGNNFAATFPQAIRTNGSNVTLTGTLTPDFVWVEANDTLFLTAGAPLVLTGVRKLRVDATGQINGVGRGYQGPAINTAGTGPGGGGTSANSGCGGGSYAGVGGTGGMDSGDTPGTGGPTYGTVAGTDCQMGSSGGSGTGISTGGNGGGALDVTAEYVEINGSINMGGKTAAVDGTGRGGGGGAGGCVLITCSVATGTGSISAIGGNGGFGTSTANDSGGGGGGGRIKTFSQVIWPGGMTLAATGGIGGPNGTAAPGQPGGGGSINNATQTFTVGVNPTMQSGQEQNFVPFGITSTNSVLCNGSSLVLDATPGLTAYLWGNGDTTSSTTVYSAGSYSVQITGPSGCTLTDTIDVTSVQPAAFAITGQGFVCYGECDTLVATGGFSSYAWSNGDTSNAILACISGVYQVQSTDSNQCVVMDSISVTVNPELLPTVIGPNSICDGSTALLDVGPGWVSCIWSTGATTQTITVTTAGSYAVTVFDANGCTGNTAFNVSVNPLPNPVVNQSGNTLTVTPTFPSYQWLLNGSPISGANAQSYTATGTGTYSVQVTDANGCTNTSDTTNVVVGIKAPATLGAMLFPNPASQSTTLELNLDNAATLELRMTDGLGRLVMQRSMEAQSGSVKWELPVADLARGVFQVTVSDGAKQQQMKFVKQ